MEEVREQKLRALFVCSKNQWRSPTAEMLWRKSPDVDVRSRGLSSKARRTLRPEDLEWADLVFVMTHEQRDRLVHKHRSSIRARDIVVLEIPDEYQYMDPELVDLLVARAGPAIAEAIAAKDDSDSAPWS